VGTVARTYRELEASGLIATRHGVGTRVTSTAPALADDQRQQLLADHAFDYVLKARLLGAADDAIIDADTHAISANPTLQHGDEENCWRHR
jgi:GntR family transcriptional regulator